MLILGITNNDTAGACLVEGKNILSAVHEERFTRIKGHKIWPQQSIDYVLKQNNKTLADVDIVAYGWNAGFNEDHSLNLYVNRVIYECQNNFANIDVLKKRISDELVNDKVKRAEFDRFIADNDLKNKVRYIDHHDTHAWGAWLCSPFQSALVVTSDGRGDFISLTVRLIEQGKETVLHRETTIDSLGYFYGRITHLLGFKPNRHEGKITGLAAHGNPARAMPLMKKMIDLKDGHIIANCGDYYVPSYQGYSEKLINEVSNYSKEDIAAAAQQHIENMITGLISPYIKNYKVKHVCLAGGLFGNVKLNQRVNQMEGIENVFVLPCMGDDGLALAAAVTAQWRETDTRCELTTMALGPDYSNASVSALLDQQPDLHYTQPADMPQAVVDLLRTDSVLAFVRGNMEFGPRALCQRSIVYHAHNKDINVWLNNQLHRTEFMPFAPVTTDLLAEVCFTDWSSADASAEYMTMTYDCKPVMAAQCPAVVHIDNTARPQVIRKEKDPFMFELIQKWYQFSGQPCLVNTSFNRHEEPIINTPEEALSVLRAGIVKAVIINDTFIVTNKE
ncbi:carbamoyltransferase C-terminal domain-containing protein [Candidatus Pantoea multigeneris]|uniref:Carbamoyl transferase n=1 Tax=Candidatus Pantoea multigeneris TaxID=2608357 RepID=A0ABX0R6P2_9GAMM|nr:carbamoyltransferase C-terminal domain-containing protein [Pantoea multigeneris]NIF20772.1 carbamoyl transferase [Pantoea multigeneris]